MAKKMQVFEKEFGLLNETREFSSREDCTKSDYKSELDKICNQYEELLNEAKLITKVSDRLQKKLNAVNASLEEKNIELQDTIDELTKAKVSRKATTLTLAVAIIIFISNEVWIEPQIDAYSTNIWYRLSVKLSLMLLLKPIDFVLEKALMKNAMNKKKKDAAKAEKEKVEKRKFKTVKT